jgi:hypothetical protein
MPILGGVDGLGVEESKKESDAELLQVVIVAVSQSISRWTVKSQSLFVVFCGVVGLREHIVVGNVNRYCQFGGCVHNNRIGFQRQSSIVLSNDFAPRH